MVEVSTKDKILSILSNGNKTLTDISRELNLSKPTVSQHLQELKRAGAILEVEPESNRKWKYYRLNPNFNSSYLPYGKNIVVSKISKSPFYYLIGIAVLAVLVLAIVLHGPAQPSQAQITKQPQYTNSSQASQAAALLQFLNVTQPGDYNFTSNQSVIGPP